jgi:translation initiation factor 2 beta subunit (eIF-2beta)/eIF-5
MIKNAKSCSGMDQRIDSIQVSKSDRQIAKEHMRDADSVADFICRAAEKLRSAEGLLSRLFVHRTQ